MRWAEGPGVFSGRRPISCTPTFQQPDHEVRRGRPARPVCSGNPSKLCQRQTARDRQGRLVTCEPFGDAAASRAPRRDGKVTVLADKFEGQAAQRPERHRGEVRRQRLVSTDPLFGINGEVGRQERKARGRPTTNVYRIAKDGQDISRHHRPSSIPNGLAFSPDEKKLYVVEWKGTPHRQHLGL